MVHKLSGGMVVRKETNCFLNSKSYSEYACLLCSERRPLLCDELVDDSRLHCRHDLLAAMDSCEQLETHDESVHRVRHDSFFLEHRSFYPSWRWTYPKIEWQEESTVHPKLPQGWPMQRTVRWRMLWRERHRQRWSRMADACLHRAGESHSDKRSEIASSKTSASMMKLLKLEKRKRNTHELVFVSPLSLSLTLSRILQLSPPVDLLTRWQR